MPQWLFGKHHCINQFQMDGHLDSIWNPFLPLVAFQCKQIDISTIARCYSCYIGEYLPKKNWYSMELCVWIWLTFPQKHLVFRLVFNLLWLKIPILLSMDPYLETLLVVGRTVLVVAQNDTGTSPTCWLIQFCHNLKGEGTNTMTCSQTKLKDSNQVRASEIMACRFGINLTITDLQEKYASGQ